MRGLILDLLVCLFVGGGVVTATSIVRAKRRGTLDGRVRELRKLGAAQAEKLAIEQEMTCIVCGAPITIDRRWIGPDMYRTLEETPQGVYTKGAWFHQACLKGEIE